MSAALAVVVVLAMGISGLSMSASKFVPTPAVRELPATSSTDQWAYGGSFSYSYSCSTTNCPGGNDTTNQTLGYSWSVSLTWAVIYTQTNVSGSQIEFSVQSAVGVSVSGSESFCDTYHGTCEKESISFSLSGQESSSGSTNVTTGETVLTAPTTGDVAALAVMNANSQESFNLSGSFSATIPEPPSPTLSDKASFDVGAKENSSIRFSTPLGIVPTTVAPGYSWVSGQDYAAGGHYVSGYTVSATVNGTSYSENLWKPGSVASTGALVVGGNDTGTTKITNNATSPPTTLTVQDILLQFSYGNFSATDGWLFISDAALDNIANGLDGVSLATHAGPLGPALVPGANTTNETNSLTGSESEYYDASTHGFIGGNVLGNLTNLTADLPGGAKLHLNAGPESVSAAQAQLNGILHPSSSSSFPLVLVLVVVVVVVVAVVAAMLLLRRGKKPAPSTAPPAAVAPPPATPPMPPTQP